MNGREFMKASAFAGMVGAFAETACRRADEVGVKTFVLGSSGARNYPADCWTKEKAVGQFTEFCKRLADHTCSTVSYRNLKIREG